MFRILVLVMMATAATCLLGGCVTQSQQLSYARGEETASPAKVGSAGTYALFVTTLPDSATTELHRESLSAGDVLGFIRDETGAARAVAGSWSKTLPPNASRAYWERVAEQPKP